MAWLKLVPSWVWWGLALVVAVMLQELRVSLFAQELKTPYPVSGKRLDKVWAQLTT